MLCEFQTSRLKKKKKTHLDWGLPNTLNVLAMSEFGFMILIVKDE